MFFPNTNVWIGGQPNNTSTISEKKGAVNIVFRVVAKKEIFVLLGYDVMRVVFLYDDVQMMMIFFSQSNFVGFCQSPSWQRAIHTVSKERGGDYRTMASSQGVLSEG